MRWEQGRTEIDAMIAGGHLQKVRASREQADQLLQQGRRHLVSAEQLAVSDPVAAYAVLYDAARKALTSVLENEGLRPTTTGGHLAVFRAVRAQLDPPLGPSLRPFDRMRRRRNEAEYSSTTAPLPTTQDVLDDLGVVEPMLAIAARMLDEMSVF